MNRKLTRSLLISAALLGSSLAAYGNDNCTNDGGFVLPSARPEVDDCCYSNFYVTGEWIYWRAREDDLEYAVSGFALVDTAVGVTSSAANQAAGTTWASSALPGKVYYADPKWSSGFRVGLGYNLPCAGWDAWDVYLNYTWYKTSTSTGTVGSSTNPVYSTSVGPTIAGGFDPTGTGTVLGGNVVRLTSTGDTAGVDWSLRYQTLDLELGRWFWTGCQLALRPSIGARGAWTRDHFNKGYLGDDAFVASPTTTSPVAGTPTTSTLLAPNDSSALTSSTNFQKIDGVGPRVALNTRWNLGSECGGCWSVFGDAAFSTLWVQYKNHGVQTAAVSVEDLDAEATIYNVQDNFDSLKNLVDLAVGLQFDNYFCWCDHIYHLGIKVGWEHHLWSGHNQMFVFPDTGGSLVSDTSVVTTAGQPILVTSTVGTALDTAAGVNPPGILSAPVVGNMVHKDSDLNLYGLSIQLRLDF